MIIFAIPLRSKKTCKNWDKVISKFENTLDSIFNQTDPDFYVIVASNQIVKTKYDNDPRLEFIVCDISVPVSWIEMARDKFYKLTLIAYRTREILLNSDSPEEGIYVMPIDADDLVSNKICKYINTHNKADVYISKMGYVYYYEKKYLIRYPYLYKFCGSCNIIKMYLDDLPEEIPNKFLCHDQEEAKRLNSRYPIRFDHSKIVDIYKKSNKKIGYLPFVSTIYIKNTGDNISEISKEILDDRFHLGVFLKRLNVFKYKRINKKIKNKFQFPY